MKAELRNTQILYNISSMLVAGDLPLWSLQAEDEFKAFPLHVYACGIPWICMSK